MNFYKKNINFAVISVFIILLTFATVSLFGKHAKATNETSRVNQVFVDYHYLLSFIYLYHGDVNEAILNYKKILPVMKNPVFYNEYSDILLYNKDYANAKKFLLYATETFPNNIELHEKLLDIYIMDKEDKKAINFIKNNKKVFQGKDLYRQLAMLYMRDENYKKAVEYFKKVNNYNKDEKILYYMAQCYMADNNFNEAIKYAEKLLKINKNNLSANMLLANLYEHTKQYQKAIDVYKNMKIRRDIKLSSIGNDYYSAGDLNKAYLYFKKAYLVNDTISYAEKAVYMLMRLGKYKDVVKFIEKNNVPLVTDKIQYFYGVSLMEQKKCKEAVETFKKIKPDSPLYKDTLYNEVLCYSKLKQKDKAFKVLNAVKNKDGNIYYMLADLHIKYKEYNQAIETILKHLDIFKNKSKAYFYVADIYYDKLKNKKEAIKYLKISLKINPDNANVLNYLGYLYIDENININKGIELVKKALKIRPDNSYYLDSLGWGYYKTKQYQKAIEFLKKAIKYRKKTNLYDDSVIEIHLVKAYLKANEKSKAKQLLKTLKKRFPKNKEVNRLLNSLK